MGNSSAGPGCCGSAAAPPAADCTGESTCCSLLLTSSVLSCLQLYFVALFQLVPFIQSVRPHGPTVQHGLLIGSLFIYPYRRRMLYSVILVTSHPRIPNYVSRPSPPLYNIYLSQKFSKKAKYNLEWTLLSFPEPINGFPQLP